ncbi:MAG TPA: serine hydrolase domain-containing protein [Ilumatobacteraceae bacterium]|nr:serine hydrolase domain-containing protein [Ilumatobacteraceae bacterium]
MDVLQRGRLLGILAVPLFMAQCAPQCAPPPPPPASIAEAWGRFDADLSARLLSAGATSASVTVSLGGEIVHSTAYGKRLGWTDEPAEAGDRFRIASISKVVTAIVVLQLVEAGRLGLDQAVGGTIAQGLGVTPIDPRFNEITVRQLLSHTSGLGTFESLVFGATIGSCPEAAQRAIGVNLGGPPGSKYTYSNLGYCLLGQLVEQVTGRSYETAARDQLLAPLGIGGMRLAGTNDVQASEVFHWQKPNRNYMDVLGPAGSWVATSADVVRIVDSLDPAKPGFHPLSPGMADLMRGRSPFLYSPDRWYGLGLICFTDGTWGHTGTLESVHAMVLHRSDGMTWSVLVSGDTPKESDDLRDMFDDVIAKAGVLPFLGL